MPSLVRKNPDDPNNPYRAGQRNAKGVIICGAKCNNGSICQDDPIKGYRRCRKHGGKVKSGIEHHNAKHMMYSKAVRDREFLERYIALVNDPDLVGLRHEIALITTYIQNKQSLLEMGVTNDIWNRVNDSWNSFYDALLDGDEATQNKMADRLNETFDEVANSGGVSESKELVPFVKEKRQLVTAEQRRMVLAQQMVTVDQTLSLLMAMVVGIKEAAYLYTSKDEADQIISHTQSIYAKITGDVDEGYLNIVKDRVGEIEGK